MEKELNFKTVHNSLSLLFLGIVLFNAYLFVMCIFGLMHIENRQIHTAKKANGINKDYI